MIGYVWNKMHAFRLGVNTLTCAIIFAPFGVKPRETISGFIGRQTVAGSRVANAIRVCIDYFHFDEPNHCIVTYEYEEKAREALCYL